MLIEWNKITWYSQVLAIVLAIIIFVIGFWLGKFASSESVPELLVEQKVEEKIDASLLNNVVTVLPKYGGENVALVRKVTPFEYRPYPQSGYFSLGDELVVVNTKEGISDVYGIVSLLSTTTNKLITDREYNEYLNAHIILTGWSYDAKLYGQIKITPVADPPVTVATSFFIVDTVQSTLEVYAMPEHIYGSIKVNENAGRLLYETFDGGGSSFMYMI